MELLNLTLGQLLAIFLPLAAGLVALYYYDRSRRRVRVSTLRFWPARSAPPVRRRHKKIQHPLSLLLQVLAALFLLLAVADWRWGSGDARRHHVLILDASSAMRYRGADGAVRMEQAKRLAEQYLAALPAGDAVQLIRAAGTAEPATALTANRQTLRDAIQATEPGWTALDLGPALDLARSSLRLTLDAADMAQLREREGVGEVAVVGAGRLRQGLEGAPTFPPLRFIEIGGTANDAGFTALTARRLPDDMERWEITVRLTNESPAPRTLTAEFYFEGRKLGERAVQAPATGESELTFRIRTTQAGLLEARLAGEDDFRENNVAQVALPAAAGRRVAVLTDRPQRFAALQGAAPGLELIVGGSAEGAALRVYDRIAASSPDAPGIFLLPPAAGSPVTISRTARQVDIESWNVAHPLAAGLREVDVTLGEATILEPLPDDAVIVSAAQGPLAVGRETASGRQVIFGFDPLSGELANRLTGPLLFANALRWMEPAAFRTAEYRAESPGALRIPLHGAAPEAVSVTALEGEAPVWLAADDRVRLFAQSPGVFEVATPDESVRLSLTLPEIGRAVWEPGAGTLRGVPPRSGGGGGWAVEFWPWLALLALALWAADWRWFGRGEDEAEAATFASAPAHVEVEQAERRREGVLR